MAEQSPELFHRREARLRRTHAYRAVVMAYGTLEDMEAPELLYLKFVMAPLDDRHKFAADAPPLWPAVSAPSNANWGAIGC